LLDRGLEGLPSTADLEKRVAAGKGLTRPELAVLLAYTKIAIKELVLQTELPEDPYLADRLQEYFPAAVRQRYPAQMANHRLAREIITTVAVNRFVDSQGATAYFRLHGETGASISDIMRAQLAARSIYKVGRLEVLLSRMPELSAEAATDLRMELSRLVERAARWLLHNRRTPLDVKAANAEFADGVILVRQALRELLTPIQRKQADESYESWVSKGVPVELAEWMCVARYAHFALGIVQTARRFEIDPVQVAAVYFRLAQRSALDKLDTQIYLLPRQERWDSMARGAVRDEAHLAHAELTAQLVAGADPQLLGDSQAVLDSWLAANPQAEVKAAVIAEICDGETDLARATVGLGTLRGLLGV
jgi:glutamate dehydrogenase